MMQFVVPNLAGGTGLALDAILAGLVIGKRFGTGGNAGFANLLHLIDGFVVFVGLDSIGIVKKKKAPFHHKNHRRIIQTTQQETEREVSSSRERKRGVVRSRV